MASSSLASSAAAVWTGRCSGSRGGGRKTGEPLLPPQLSYKRSLGSTASGRSRCTLHPCADLRSRFSTQCPPTPQLRSLPTIAIPNRTLNVSSYTFIHVLTLTYGCRVWDCQCGKRRANDRLVPVRKKTVIANHNQFWAIAVQADFSLESSPSNFSDREIIRSPIVSLQDFPPVPVLPFTTPSGLATRFA